MSLTVREVTSRKDLIKFIKFQHELYKDNKYFVPPLITFEVSTLNKDKNPAFDHAEAKYWMVEKNGQTVGRIAAIILDQELKEKSLARFGWIDFIDDKEVSDLLLETAKSWALEKGANAIHGPLGFTDLDYEGALIEGYDVLPTQATIYNYPYYIDHFKAWGLETITTWCEKRMVAPKEISDKITRVTEMVKKRSNLSVKELKKSKEIKKYAKGIFNVINKSYSHLYGYHELSPRQIDYYVDMYLGFVRKEFVCIVVDENDEVIGFSIALPSLSKALQKAKGKLFPFGFIHILRAFKSNKEIDLLLGGVLPEYRTVGGTFIYDHMNKVTIKKNVQVVNSGPMLEDNHKIQTVWKDYEHLPVKIRRSCFHKNFND